MRDLSRVGRASDVAKLVRRWCTIEVKEGKVMLGES